MLGMALDHKMVLVIEQNHLLSLKDVNATSNIVLNVKVGYNL